MVEMSVSVTTAVLIMVVVGSGKPVPGLPVPVGKSDRVLLYPPVGKGT